jgi:two-component system OmpR family response regulator
VQSLSSLSLPLIDLAHSVPKAVPSMRVLLVEDHPPLAEAVCDALQRAGFAVDHASDARAARDLAGLADYALVLLDLGLPDEDGLRLLPVLRQGGRVPVIVLTARDQLADRLAGLDGGADDYVVKPVEMPELVARARAVLRRPGDRSDRVLRLGPLALDTVARSVSVHDTPLPLGRRELGVLEQLMRSAGRVASRHVLEEAIYTLDDEVTPNALEAAVSRLRRALAQAGCPVPIVNVRGVGWMLPRDGGQ